MSGLGSQGDGLSKYFPFSIKTFSNDDIKQIQRMKHDEGSNLSVEIYISNQNLDTDSCGHAKNCLEMNWEWIYSVRKF